jgi:hypothetical protein
VAAIHESGNVVLTQTEVKRVFEQPEEAICSIRRNTRIAQFV